jgi:DNA invertase Pin-like site-specific DNA recombinase
MSDDRQDKSIAQQTDWARGACRRERVEILREFADEGVPGDEIARRPGLQALIAYCEERAGQGQPVGAVVTWNGDRFSRADSLRTAVVWCRLLDAGTKLLLTNEGWTDFEDDADRALYSIKQDFGRSAYVKGLAENCTRGVIKRAKEGRYCGGPVPYAFVVGPDGYLALGDPAEVEAVRWMYNAYDRGLSVGRICAELDRRGVPIPRGGRKRSAPGWRKKTVWKILTNPVYVGTAAYGRRLTGKYAGVNGDRVVKRKPPRTKEGTVREVYNPVESQVRRPDNHPAIVSVELFERVRQRLRANRAVFAEGEKQDRRTADWPLSGLLFCAHCGARMWGLQDTCRGRTVRRYACSSYRERGTGACDRNAVREDVILPAVFDAVRAALADDDTQSRLRKILADRLRKGRKQATAGAESLRRRADDLGEKVRTGTQRLAICPADLMADVAAEVRAWKEEREELLRQLARAQNDAAAEESEARQIEEAMAAFGRLSEVVKNPGCQAEAAAAAQALVENVRVHFTHTDHARTRRGKFHHACVNFKPPLTVLGVVEAEPGAEPGAEPDAEPAAEQHRRCPAPSRGTRRRRMALPRRWPACRGC